MHRRGDGTLVVSATDLVGFLECGHLTNLEMQAVAGLIHKPSQREDPEVLLLQRRGGQHEQRYIDLLESRGRQVIRGDDDWGHSYEDRAAATIELMDQGVDVIYQATVFDGRWLGYPDFLLRKEGRPPSVSRVQGITRSPERDSIPEGEPQTGLGREWHYEVADTKLAHVAKASALIQIASYVEQIERIQGVRPEHVYVVTGGKEPEEHPFRTAEMMAYYRRAKQRYEQTLAQELDVNATYPDPVEHCAVCKWYGDHCWRQWRQDDALPLVAGITRAQRTTLKELSVVTRGALATATGLDPKLDKVRQQARIQVASDPPNPLQFELLPPESDAQQRPLPDRGLSALPEPNEGDLFFDIEGDPFAFWEGLEYLFGVWERPRGDGLWDDGYTQIWAYDEENRQFTREQEKRSFEQVMDLFTTRRAQFPKMHIYHYGVYEPSRLKRLAGQHATRQEDLDALLRGRVFVDLFRVVKQGVRVGAESYSIKKLEPLYGYTREIALRDANSSMVEFESMLEGGDPDGSLKTLIAGYNRDDCKSTEQLRDWLELRRNQAKADFGFELPRPRPEADSEKPKPPTQWDTRLAAVRDRLIATGDVRAKFLGDVLDFHRREDKASWWRFFELLTMSDAELLLEQEPIAGLRYQGVVKTNRAGNEVHEYTFPVQEHRVGGRSELYDPKLPPFDGGQLKNGGVDKDNLKLWIVHEPGWDGSSVTAVVPKERIPFEGLQERLAELGEWVADNDIHSNSREHRDARDLLRALTPRVAGGIQAGADLYTDEEGGSAAAKRLACIIDATTLAIQGPPGSGKTYSGARMVLELVRDGRRVGITGSSHKVITNFLAAIWKAAREEETALEILQRIDPDDSEERPWTTAKDNNKVEKLLSAEDHDFTVLGGTVYFWARADMDDWADTLFVDEAGQVALANVLPAAHACSNIVLLGDPRQLDQVLQGSHPPGANASSLGHYLGEHETIPRSRGVFLEKTWRMHPRITDYTSELFYEGKLTAMDGLGRQRIDGTDWLSGSGLRWRPIEHDDNTNSSEVEADEVVRIVGALIGRDWMNAEGTRAQLRPEDLRVVSPFNAHRLLIDAKLKEAGISGVPVGTVDKFQGQEAPVSIYTMATSRPEDAPRGLNFLYSLNRLNVATSRARALAILIASPRLLDVVPGSPDQLRMANGLAAFVEAAVDASM